MASNTLEYSLQLRLDKVDATLKSLLQTINSNLGTAGSKAGDEFSSNFSTKINRLGNIIDVALGNVLATGLTKGLSIATNSINNFVSGATTQFDSYNKAITTLEIIAPRFNLDANQAKLTAESLAKELKIGVGTSAESLQNLFKSGLNIDQSSDLLRRFNNEAITGKSANISLDDAIQNLSFAYNTQNSAIGNLSGISENFSDIQQRGLKILQSRGELIGKSIGQLDEAQKKEAQYAGIIDLTNLTQGSSEKFIGTRIDNQIRLNKVITDGQIALGKKLDPVFNQALIALTPIIESLISKINQLDFSQISDGIKSFNVQPIIDSIKSFDLSKFIQDVVAFKDVLIQVSPIIVGAVTSLAGLSVFNFVISTITSIIAVLAFLISPISLIIIGITGLVSIGIYLYQNFQLVQTILTAIQPIIDFLSLSFQNLFNYLGGGNIILGFFSAIFTTLVGVFNTALPIIIGIIAQLGFFAIQVGVLAGYMITQLYPVFLQVVQAASNLIVALQPLIDTFIIISGVLVNVLLAGFNLVFPIIGAIVTQYIGAIGTIFSGLINIISGVINVISFLFTGDFGRAFQGLQQIFQGGVQVITGIFQGVIAPIRGVFDGVLNLFTTFSLASKAVEWVNGFINTVRSKFGEVTSIISNILSNIRLPELKFPEIKLPSIPSFASGTDFFEGGLARFGERGRELLQFPNGLESLVNQDTTGALPRGTRILNNLDTNRYLKNNNNTNNNQDQRVNNSKQQYVTNYSSGFQDPFLQFNSGYTN